MLQHNTCSTFVSAPGKKIQADGPTNSWVKHTTAVANHFSTQPPHTTSTTQPPNPKARHQPMLFRWAGGAVSWGAQ